MYFNFGGKASDGLFGGVVKSPKFGSCVDSFTALKISLKLLSAGGYSILQIVSLDSSFKI